MDLIGAAAFTGLSSEVCRVEEVEETTCPLLRRNHDRPEPPDGGGAGDDNDGAEEGRRAEEG